MPDRRPDPPGHSNADVAVVCTVPRSAGAGAAIALVDRVCALFRDCTIGGIRLGTPAVELDGRDPDGFRAVVTLPLRRPPPNGDMPCQPPPPEIRPVPTSPPRTPPGRRGPRTGS